MNFHFKAGAVRFGVDRDLGDKHADRLDQRKAFADRIGFEKRVAGFHMPPIGFEGGWVAAWM